MAIAPAPFHVSLGGYHFKLARRDDDTLDFERFPTPFFPDRVSEKAATQSSFPPDARIPYTFGAFRGGYGQSRQDGAEETDRYFTAGARGAAVDEGVDASGDAGAVLGPLVARTTLTGFTPTSGYWFALGTNLFLAATDGTNTRVYQHNTTTLSMDLAATIATFVVRDAIVYRGSQASDYAYLAGGVGVAMQYSTNGTAWAAATGATNAAEKLAKIDGQLVRYLSGDVDFATNGGTAPTFAGPLTVGDKIGTGNGLYNHADRLVTGKSTGLFVLASDRLTLDQNLWADLWENGPDTRTFAGGIVWRNQLVTPFKQGLRAISPSFAATNIGWDTLPDNDSPVYGVPSGLAGDTFHLYATSASGHLMKGLAVHSEAGAIGSVKWHPHLYLGTTSVRSFVWNGATGGAPQLFLLLATGAVARIVLSNTGNPLTDTRYRFCPGGVLEEPWLYAGFTTTDKLTFAIEADGRGLTNSQTIQYAYQLPTASSYTSLTSAQTTNPGVRQDITPTPPQGRAIRVRATFATNDSALTPILRSTTLQFQVLPDPLPSVQMLIDCNDGAMLADGSQQHVPPSVASDRLWAMVNSGIKSFIDPYGRSLDVTIPLDGMRDIAGKDHGPNTEPDLLVRVMARGQKQRTRGTWDRVEQLTWDYVAAQYTWDSLPLSA